ncbi:hypothetical protein MHY87_04765 [Microvirga sp. ACRRW]|uniref:calcium-binding protein n=1 Tax=Microvirga sp. ACRRW TaxID=2918205 RepID=UPI001EF517E2|nr:calcium-binding protein [Microvirga sp. ACRRW]MCG7392212.1 hypothetical protein [Microvirga sp. ACRRW]
MPIHVIDSSKPLPPTYEDRQHALVLGMRDTVIVGEGAEIAAYGASSYGIRGSLGNTFIINGRVHSEQSHGIATQGTITIGEHGSVHGGLLGVYFLYDGNFPLNVLTNAGTISAQNSAVYLEGSPAIVLNSGTIDGTTGINFSNTYSPSHTVDQTLVVNNTGLIKGTGATHRAIAGSTIGSNTVINSGRIEGDVRLGDYNDVYDGRGGTVTGKVWLGAGDDVFYGGDGSETVWLGKGSDVADGGEGIDTLDFSAAATVDLRIIERQQTGSDSWATISNIENLNGSGFDDRFIGNAAANALIGNGGNDTLDGYDGNDLLSGGAGDDLLVGGAGSDTAVFTGKFSDYTITVKAGSITITDKRASGDGTDILGGIEFALFSDRIYTLAPVPPIGTVTPSTPTKTSDTPTTTDTPPATPVAKNLTFKGGKKADTFVGGKGHDLLNGGLGKDKLTGNEGQDTFVFNSKLGSKNVDRITDFTHSDDSLKLSKSIFSKIEKGMLSKGAFWIGTKAHDKSDRIIYNDKTGALFYDADGAGKKYGAVKFAQLNPKTLLKHDDFFIA